MNWIEVLGMALTVLTSVILATKYVVETLTDLDTSVKSLRDAMADSGERHARSFQELSVRVHALEDKVKRFLPSGQMPAVKKGRK